MNFSILFANDIKIFFPEIFFSLAILIVLVYGVLVATSLTYNYPLISRNIYALVLYVIFLTGLLVLNNPVDYALIFQKTFLHDDLSRIAKLFVLGSAFACLILSQSYVENSQINNYEYFLLILFSIFGLNLLISSNDLISAYLAIEMQALSFYVMASFQRRSVFSTEAGLKYFILGAFSSGLLLYAFSLIYGVTGTTNLVNIKNFCLDPYFDGANIIQIALIFLTAGFLFKIAAFPFHMWSPDVYEGSPTSITIFFAVVPKLAVVTFFVRLYSFSFPSFSGVWEKVLLFSALGSIIYSAFVSIKQNSLKRLLAYSSIGHVGFILLPLSTNSLDGLQAVFFYMLVYMITSLPTWAVVLACMNGKKNSQNNINILAGLSTASPIMGILAALAFFSLAGIPPLVGFYSKIFVFFSAIKSSLYIVAFIVLAASVVSTFYYISVVKTIYFEKNRNWIFYNTISKEKSIILSISLILLVFLFVNPNVLLLLSQQMALSVI
uniref:NADH dehydrogenase subunit 2 n=1 Tax=Monodopsis sp. MarTras21 TaxID=1745953 RepID=A0A140F2V9_9STRA|nr:NADH dehydrogenase subunit 2 [Monodopsis sp. MarTras21]